VAEGNRTTLSLPPAGWLGAIFAAVALAAMLTLLILQLAVLKDSRQHIQAQDAKISKLVGESGPVLRRADPLLGRVAPLVRDVSPLVRRLTRTVDVAQLFFTALNSNDRLVRTVDESNALLDALARTDFLERSLRAADLAPEALRVAYSTLATQRQTLRTQLETRVIQARSLRTQLRTLSIQREALRHIESIDRKTGGQVPAATPAVP
jgi:uncharacterized protein YoxC